MGDVGTPGDDIDPLVGEFPDYALNPRTLHADAGADRVDPQVVASDRHLAPLSGRPGDPLDLDDPLVDLRDLDREEPLHELRVPPAQDD
jgi:hypothetical protein